MQYSDLKPFEQLTRQGQDYRTRQAAGLCQCGGKLQGQHRCPECIGDTEGARRRKQWAEMDFSRPTKEIAWEMGVSVPAVIAQRRSRGAQGQRERRVKAWAAVDWRMKNAAIAEKMGVQIPAVVYQRKKRL